MTVLKILLAIVTSLLLLVALLLTGFSYGLDRTLLNPAFVHAEIEQADVISFLKTGFIKKLPADEEAFAPAVAAAIDGQRPLILRQAHRAVDDTYDYFLGRTDRWQLTIETKPFKQALLENVRTQLKKNPPADYQKLSPEQKQQFGARLEREVNELDLPDKFDAGTLDADQKKEISKAREQIQIFKKGYTTIMVADGLLILLLLWAGSSLWLAIIALISGLGFHVILVLSRGLGEMMPVNFGVQLPVELQAYFPKFYDHLSSPLRAYAWGCLLGGLFFFVLWFVLRSVRRSWTTRSVA